MKKYLVVSSMLASSFVGTATAAAPVPRTVPVAHHGTRTGCHKLYNVAMGKRAARAVYSGTRHVTHANYVMLGRIEKCQRNPRSRAYVRWYDRHLQAAHAQRVYAASHPFNYATASWYDDSGETASGYHAGYGVANLWMSFGTRLTVCYHSQCVSAVVDDRGPYVGGRDFDLNQNVAGALGFDGVDTVAWRYG